MTRLTWTEGKHYGGVDRGVVYSRSGLAQVWNGLISVTEIPTDIRQRVRYRDGVKIVNHRSEESFSATIDCFTYPDSFLDTRMPFDMSYRVKTSKGHEIHLIYNAMAQVKTNKHSQLDPSGIAISVWTRPNPVSLGYAPTAHLVIDETLAYPPAFAAFETVLYGAVDSDPGIPSPNEVFNLFDVNALYKVIDNGDGTFTLEAPDDVFEWMSATAFEADWPTAVYLDSDTYTVRNW